MSKKVVRTDRRTDHPQNLTGLMRTLFLLFQQFRWDVHVEHCYCILNTLGIALNGRELRLLAAFTEGGSVGGQFIDMCAEFADVAL